MKPSIITICVSFLLLIGCAPIQHDTTTLDERLLALESNYQELEKKNKASQNQIQSERSLRSQVAGITADMDSLQQEIRLLKGRLEEIEHLSNRQAEDEKNAGKNSNERLDKVSLKAAKIDQRLTQLEQYLNIEGKSGESSAPSPKTADGSKPKTAAKTEKSDKELYDQARKALDNGQMDLSRKTFQKLIKTHPKSEQADNAQFWIGESYYREKWFERAILEYQKVIEKYSKGNKVAAAMLKQGLALSNIGEKSSARLILQELVKKFPKSSEAGVAAKKLKAF